MTVQDSVRVFESVSLGYPRYHCASPKNKKQTNTKSMWGAWYGLLGFVLKPLLKKNIMRYLIEILNLAVLTAICLYGFIALSVMI